MATLQSALWGFGELTANAITARWNSLDGHSAFFHQQHWLSGADEAFDHVVAGLQWGPAERRPMYNRIIDVPRLNKMIARSELHNAATSTPLATVNTVVHNAERLIGTRFDHIGINYYRDGRDSVTWHRDQIGNDRSSSVIALVSLGGPRAFRIRPFRRTDGTSTVDANIRYDLTLHSGDLLVMAGACQRDWEHAVPKVASAPPRISIVMRTKRSCEGPLFDG